MKSGILLCASALILSSCASANPPDQTALRGQNSPPPRGQMGGPPPEAFEACATSDRGDNCTVITPQGTLTGRCETDQRSNRLLCAIERAPEAQRRTTSDGRPQRNMRQHTTIQSSGQIELYPAIIDPIAPNRHVATLQSDERILSSNSISTHKTGEFPNPGNPNSIAEMDLTAAIPANPVYTGVATRVKEPGYTMEGVQFDPGAGEFYMGDPSLGWQYEALSGAIELGLDDNHAHVQPTGKYHYHGLPSLYLEAKGVQAGVHSPQIGWAMDGFPIYALYGYSALSGDIIEMTSSYRVKPGQRPSADGQPGGTYDGTFTADYEYVAGSGTLDECNGAQTVNADYPAGTYAYFLTPNYPSVPRCLMGEVSQENRGPHQGAREDGNRENRGPRNGGRPPQ